MKVHPIESYTSFDTYTLAIKVCQPVNYKIACGDNDASKCLQDHLFTAKRRMQNLAVKDNGPT